MKKRKHLQTSFIKYILEKYSNGQGLPDEEEIEIPDDENETPQLRIKKKLRKLNELEDDDNEVQDDEETTEDEDDEIIDELLNEYKRLKRKYESKSYRIPIRRKR